MGIRFFSASAILLALVSTASAQPPLIAPPDRVAPASELKLPDVPETSSTAPQTLPSSILKPTDKPSNLPTKTKIVATNPTNSTEPILSYFNPSMVNVQFENNRYRVWAGREMVRDCGLDIKLANNVMKLIGDNQFAYRCEIPGSNPTFECWLVEKIVDSKKTTPAASDALTSLVTMIPFDPTKLEVKQMYGAWCIRDAGRIIYNFGQREESAKQALEILKKFEFNAIAYCGLPQPNFCYPVRMPSAMSDLEKRRNAAAASGIVDSATKYKTEGFFVPEYGYVGHRKPIDAQKMQLARGREWLLISGQDTLFNFHSDEMTARQVLKAFGDWRISEYVDLGEVNVRFFLSYGQAPRGMPFNGRTVAFRNADLKVEKGKDDHYWLMGGRLPILDCGNSEKDAKLILATAKHLGIDSMVKYGNSLHGEHIILIRTQ